MSIAHSVQHLDIDLLINQPLPNGFPWGDRPGSADRPPLTGVTRRYDWTVSRQVISPDGMPKNALLINGQFPGPLIEANWGDWIEGQLYHYLRGSGKLTASKVAVHNNITGPEEGTSIHWHGQWQRGTPEMDGIPTVSQCPIAPDSSFTYAIPSQTSGQPY